MYNGRNQTETSMTLTSSTLYFRNTDVHDTCWASNNFPLWPAPAPRLIAPHRLATTAAMRDKSARMHRRPRDEARRSPALERRTWTAAPRRVL
jgi:hypothetical protein